MVTQAIVSAVVMGLLVAAVFVAVSRLNTVSRASSGAAKSDRYRPGREPAEGLSEKPGVLGLVFVVVALLAGVVTLGAVGGLPFSLGVNAFGLVMALLGLVVAAFLFLGPYAVVRQNGFGNALGVAAGIGGLGVAFLLLILVQLVVGIA